MKPQDYGNWTQIVFRYPPPKGYPSGRAWVKGHLQTMPARELVEGKIYQLRWHRNGEWIPFNPHADLDLSLQLAKKQEAPGAGVYSDTLSIWKVD